MGHQKTYSWEFKVQMVHLLEKGQKVSQKTVKYEVVYVHPNHTLEEAHTLADLSGVRLQY